MKQFNLSVAFLLIISFWCFSGNLSAQKSYQNEKAEIYMKKVTDTTTGFTVTDTFDSTLPHTIYNI